MRTVRRRRPRRSVSSLPCTTATSSTPSRSTTTWSAPRPRPGGRSRRCSPTRSPRAAPCVTRTAARSLGLHGPRGHRPHLRRDLRRRAARTRPSSPPWCCPPGTARSRSGSASAWRSACRRSSRSPSARLATLLPDALVEVVALPDLPGRRDRCCCARRPGADAAEKEQEEEFAAKATEPKSGRQGRASRRFLVLFAAEWGDLSQLLTISLVGEVPRPPSASSSAPGPRCSRSRASRCVAGRVLLRYMRLSCCTTSAPAVCLLLAVVTAYEVVRADPGRAH